MVILGNHEEELLAAKSNDADAFQRWLAMGGVATLASYGVETHLVKSDEEWAFASAGPPKLCIDALKVIPQSHWQVLDQALNYWEFENYFFTHAGYDPDQPLEKQSAMELRWLALDDWKVRPHCSGKTAIVGHTPNLSGHISSTLAFLRCLDTVVVWVGRSLPWIFTAASIGNADKRAKKFCGDVVGQSRRD